VVGRGGDRLNGATWLADSLLHHGMLPKRVHAVDTFVSSDSPLEDPRYGDAKLGQGAVVRAVDTSHEAPIEAVRATLKLAKDKDIPLQYGVTSGGNDGVPFAERGRSTCRWRGRCATRIRRSRWRTCGSRIAGATGRGAVEGEGLGRPGRP
jgi:hypothetical protein